MNSAQLLCGWEIHNELLQQRDQASFGTTGGTRMLAGTRRCSPTSALAALCGTLSSLMPTFLASRSPRPKLWTFSSGSCWKLHMSRCRLRPLGSSQVSLLWSITYLIPVRSATRGEGHGYQSGGVQEARHCCDTALELSLHVCRARRRRKERGRGSWSNVYRVLPEQRAAGDVRVHGDLGNALCCVRSHLVHTRPKRPVCQH